MKKIVKLAIKIALILVLLVFAAVFALQALAGTDYVKGKIRSAVSEYIEAELDYGALRLSFFKHFPHLYLSVEDLQLTASGETLAGLESAELVFDYLDIVNGRVNVPSFIAVAPHASARTSSDGALNWRFHFPDSDGSGDSFDFSKLSIGCFEIRKGMTLAYASPSGKYELDISTFKLYGSDNRYHLDFISDGLELALDASVDDLRAKDPDFDIGLDASLDLPRMLSMLDLDKDYTVRGALDAVLNGHIRLSQMNLQGISHSSLAGRLKGSDLEFSIPADSIMLYAERPFFSLAPGSDADGELHVEASTDSLIVRGKDFLLSAEDIDLAAGILSLYHGDLSIGNMTIQTPLFPLENRIWNVKGGFDGEGLLLSELNISAGSSLLKASGRLSGLREAILEKGLLNLDFRIDAERINADEILAALEHFPGEKTSSDNQVSGSRALMLPSNFVMDFDVDADRVDWSDLQISRLTTCIRIQDRMLQITDTELDSNMGGISLDAFYSTQSESDITTGMDLRLMDVTADDVIRLIPHVDSIVPLLKAFKGKLNCDLAVTTRLDADMSPILPSVEGVMKVSGSGLQVDGVRELRKLTRLLLFKNRDVVSIDDVAISAVIYDGKVELFPFQLGVDRYSFILRGEQDFDQSFDYHVSVLKSPIPFRFGVNLDGDFSDWHFRLGRAKYRDSKNIAEYESTVERMRDVLRNAIHNIFERGSRSALREHRRSIERAEGSRRMMLYREAVTEASDSTSSSSDMLERRLSTMAEEQENNE